MCHNASHLISIQEFQKKMNFSTAALNQTPLDFEGNFRRVRDAIRAAKERKSFLLVLPELCLSGCGCQNHFRRPEMFDHSLTFLERILPETQGITTTIGFPCQFNARTYNATAWVSDGFIEFVHLKTDFDECLTPRNRESYSSDTAWFDPWEQNLVDDCILLGNSVPIGDFRFFEYLFSYQEKPLAVQLRIGNFNNIDKFTGSGAPAEVISSKERLQIETVDLIVHCGCVPFAFGRFERVKEKIRQFSRESDGVYLFANTLGYESGEFIYDGATLIAEKGEIVAQSRRFSYHDWTVLSRPILVEQENQGKESESQPNSANAARIQPVWTKEEEFAEVIPLALFDYLRKSRSNGFVLSLSGGADSGAIAVLVALMVHFGWNELSRDGFLKKLEYIPELQSVLNDACSNDRNFSDHDLLRKTIAKLLNCVYQKTRNSSETTQNAAEHLAETLGATFHNVSVDALVQNYNNLATSIYGKALSWDKNDLALQNIQARVRAPLVWFLANLKGALLLSTGNRSEITLGYATMDGDTCGVISPIGGVDKVFLCRWLRWMQSTGPLIHGKDRFPIPVLRAINEQVPTAELRPPEFTQKDEADLMPYTVLNRLETLLLKEFLSQERAVALLEKEFPQYTPNDLQRWTSKFFVLWTRNQWKRKRYALTFYVDDEAPDPNDLDQYPALSNPTFY